MGRKFLVMAAAGLCAATGCGELLLGIPLLIGQSQFEARRAAKPCKGQPCDPNQWIRVFTVPDLSAPAPLLVEQVTADVPGLHCTLNVELPYVEPYDADAETGELVTSLAVRSDDLTLAVLTHIGRVHVADFGADQEKASADLDAVGIGWSNATARLAVISPAEQAAGAGGTFVVRLFDEGLAELDAWPLTLGADAGVSSEVPLEVSWSADDRWIAVSTPSFVPSGAPVRPRCLVVSVEDGTSATAALSDAYFVGTASLVATEAHSGGTRVRVYRLEDGALVPESPVPDALSVITADAVSGVFVTAEPPPPFVTPPPTVGMRMVGLGPQLLLVSGNAANFQIVPWNDSTRAALVAASLDPATLVADPDTRECVARDALTTTLTTTDSP